jgi:DNA mismatch repair ATPase MutS
MFNNSKSLARLRDWVSEIDLEIGIARLKGICFPKAQAKKGTFVLNIDSLYHPGVGFGKRVMNNVRLGPDSNNMLITGPNRGGKSTLCKSIGFAVMCAQSWGFAWAKSMTFVPVSRLETALAPADTLGRLSLFEAEIEFAKHLLAVSEKARGNSEDAPCLIIMDEIFHSTNAHDGAEASLIFLKQLYEKGGNSIGSVISTHYRELPDKLTGIRSYCMEAFDKGKDGITYTYRCIPGISTISSVREILKERGLLHMENSIQSTISNEHP